MRDRNCCLMVRYNRDVRDLFLLCDHASIGENQNSTFRRASDHGMFCCFGCGVR